MFKAMFLNKRFDVKAVPGFQGMALLTFLCLYAPIIIVIMYSFNSSPSLGVFESFSLKWYIMAWNNIYFPLRTLRTKLSSNESMASFISKGINSKYTKIELRLLNYKLLLPF